MKARDINDTIRYTMWSVFRRTSSPAEPAGASAADALEAAGRAFRDGSLD